MHSINSIPSARQRRRVSPLADELSAIFSAIDDEPLLSALARYRWTGRPGWSLRALWRAYIAGYTLGLPTTNALVRRLQDDPALREVCGFTGGALPSRWTFNRFVSRLSHHADAVERVLAALTDRLHELLPDFGKGLALDASTVRSWSNPDKPRISDPEASWTGKAGRGKNKTTWYWGYKLHLIVDAKYELPVTATVTTASPHDSTEFQPLLRKARELHAWLRPSYVTADAGYDGKRAYEFVVREMQSVPIIKLRRTKRTEYESPDIADEDGTPRCLGGQEMTFLGHTADGNLRYACPAGGCHLRAKREVVYCDATAEIDPTADLRRFALIPRKSPRWHELYSTRQSVERCFSRLKQHRALDSHCRRGLRKVRLHALMGLVTMQAAAVVRAERGEVGRVREVSRRVA